MNARGDIRHEFALYIIVVLILWTGLTGFIAVARYQQEAGYLEDSSNYTAVDYSNLTELGDSGLDMWDFLGSVGSFAFSGEMLIIVVPLAAIIGLFAVWIILTFLRGY